MNPNLKWILPLLSLAACGGQNDNGAKPPENSFAVVTPFAVAAENLAQGLDCAFKTQPHEIEVTNLGESTEIWVQFPNHDKESLPRFEVKHVGKFTLISMISDRSASPPIQDLKSYVKTGTCSQSPAVKG